MSAPVILANDQLEVVLTPRQGAGILAFFACHKGRKLSLMPDARASDNPLQWCSWLMIPYSNRIQDGVFSFEGRVHHLENGPNHAIHGDTRTRPWQVLRQTSEELTCRFSSQQTKGFNWPWNLESTVEYRLAGRSLSQKVRIVNRDNAPMPAGGGFHPYFCRSLTRPGEPVRVKMAFQGLYPDAQGTRIPSGPAGPVPPELDFSGGRDLPPDQAFDICTTGYDGLGEILWPETGLGLSFHCSPELSHLVLYNPIDQPYFAVEPVANANDGVNLLARGDPTSGMHRLLPGEEILFSFRLELAEL